VQIDGSFFIYIGFGLIILELLIGVATGFDLALLGVTSIIGGMFFKLTGNLTLTIIIVSAIIFSYFLLGRKIVRKKLLSTTQKTNIERLIDAEGTVVKKIVPGNPGQVKVESEVWRAESEQTLGLGSKIKVKSIDGVTLKVTRKE